MEFSVDVSEYLLESERTLNGLQNQVDLVSEAASLMIASLRANGTIFWMGNGGSASDAQHLAAELVGRFELNRKPLRSIALTTDTSILTAISNDFGFVEVFERQIRALVRGGDIVVGISTSGRSENVIRGLRAAMELGASTILFTGPSVEPEIRALSGILIEVQSERTCHIQEAHIAIGQVICGIVERELAR